MYIFLLFLFFLLSFWIIGVISLFVNDIIIYICFFFASWIHLFREEQRQWQNPFKREFIFIGSAITTCCAKGIFFARWKKITHSTHSIWWIFTKYSILIDNDYYPFYLADSPSSSADSYSSSSSTRKLLSAPVHDIQTTTATASTTIPMPSLAASRIIDIKVRDDKKISIEKAVDVWKTTI